MSKLGFLARFLAYFALLLSLWSVSPASEWCTAAILWVAATLGPILHGWVLAAPSPGTPFHRWMLGGQAVELRIHFDALAVGVVPFVALIAATPGLARWRRARAMVAGSIGCLAIDTLIVVLFPLLVHHENALTGIGGTFLGVIGFVGAPAILWFALAHREVRAWLPSLREASGEPPAPPRR